MSKGEPRGSHLGWPQRCEQKARRTAQDVRRGARRGLQGKPEVKDKVDKAAGYGGRERTGAIEVYPMTKSGLAVGAAATGRQH